jgi:hypothetical protein
MSRALGISGQRATASAQNQARSYRGRSGRLPCLFVRTRSPITRDLAILLLAFALEGAGVREVPPLVGRAVSEEPAVPLDPR